MAQGLAAYGVLARHYDRLLAAMPYRRWTDFIARQAKTLLVDTPRIVDLGCGTGRVAAGLARRGFAVTGVDSSSEMLAMAADRSRKVAWLEQDYRQLNLAADLFCCTCDGLNHITRPADLTQLLVRLHRLLSDGGLLVFDVNTEKKYRRQLADNSFHFQYPDLHVVWDNSFQYPYNYARLTLFQSQGGGFIRHQAEIVQRCHPLKTLLYYLYQSGFDPVGLYNNYRSGADVAAASRLTVVARKGRRK